MLELKLSRQAQKFLKKLKVSDLKVAKNLIAKIKDLQNNPKLRTSTELVNYSPFRRIRVGKYRIIYKYNSITLYITLIKKRDSVYKEIKKLR